MESAAVWGRRRWFAGIVFVVALVAETAVSAGLPINQNDSPAKIALALHDHRDLVLIAAYFSAVYAVAFVIYLCTLHDALSRATGRRGVLHSLVLVGGALMVAFHAASDVGIYGLLGGKLATYGALHDHGLSYTLYLLTFALDSVGDVFGSTFLLAAGLLILRGGILPRWLAQIAIAAGILLFVQAFGLGGVINTFGLIVDLVGFLLFLLFVLLSSALELRRGGAVVPADVVD
jgi:hypothetical protein